MLTDCTQVFWILAPYMIYTLAFGGIIVPRLNLILNLVCSHYFADQTLIDPNFNVEPVVFGVDNPQCRIPEVQRSVATFMLVMNLCVGGLSAVVAPKLGHLSDRYGRRRLLALASTGGLMNELVTIIAAKFPETVDYRVLILGSVFDGLTGSLTAGGILSQSYTSDCTSPSQRSVAIGYLTAALFTGLALGPLLAGYFIQWTGSLLSIFYVAFGCHTFFILFVAFVIPESLSPKKRAAAREKWAKEKQERAQTSRWSAIQNANPLLTLKVLWPTGPGTSRRLRLNLVCLAICDVVLIGVGMAAGPIIMLYAEYIFGWGNLETSQFVSTLSMVRVITLALVLPIIIYLGRILPARRRRLRTGEAPPPDKNAGADQLDLWILRFALCSDILGFLGFALSREPAFFWLSAIVTAFGGMGSATGQAVLTKLIPMERTGQVLGAVGTLHALARVVGPIAFNGLYAATVATVPQAFFVLIMALFVVALVASFFITPRGKTSDFQVMSSTDNL